MTSNNNGIKRIEYMCTYCGTKKIMSRSNGRPQPGTCSRRSKNMPHRWVINRRIY